jgi:hypothetical protein
MRLDDRLAPREIVRALAAGEVSGVEATQLPVRAVYDITHHERRRRRAAAEREQAKTEKGRARLVLRTMLTEVEERMAADPSTAELYTLSRAMPNLVRGLDTLGDPEPLLDAPQPNGQQAVPEEDGFERRLEERHQADLHRRAEEEAQQQADAEEPGKALSLKDMLEDKSPEGHRRLAAYLREQSYVTEEMADQLMRKHGFDPALAA